jgi:Toxin co-regulated pilus biosynthesis protein Q
MIFRKLFAFFAFFTMTGYAFAEAEVSGLQMIPVWPMHGTDADVTILPNSADYKKPGDENIKIVSSVGADMRVENNINVGQSFGSFSGGADMTQPYQAPAGFNQYENQAEMPFMHSEMLEDDGASVLAVSKSNRKPVIDKRGVPGASTEEDRNAELTDIAVDTTSEEPAKELKDQVRSWVVASGQNLKGVLQVWCDKEGWDLVWNTPREYPIEASAVFKGRFMDVASALVRNFSRATPIPYAKFYKGNRVLVVSTMEDN